MKSCDIGGREGWEGVREDFEMVGWTIFEHYFVWEKYVKSFLGYFPFLFVKGVYCPLLLMIYHHRIERHVSSVSQSCSFHSCAWLCFYLLRIMLYCHKNIKFLTKISLPHNFYILQNVNSYKIFAPTTSLELIKWRGQKVVKELSILAIEKLQCLSSQNKQGF